MADHALFYNSVDHDRVYDANSFSDWLKKFFTNGVFEGDLFVTATSGMTISVGSGYVNVEGKVMIYDSPTQFTLEPANGIYPRIDTIVVERNDTDRDIFLKVVKGDYSNLNDPVPTPPVRGGGIYQLVLAQIYVGAGATEITQANITDTRSDPDLCGIVTGTVEEMDFSQFAAQFQAYYVEFVTGHEAEFEQWMQGEENTFIAWVATLHDILDSETAGHLQLEIDGLDDRLDIVEDELAKTKEVTASTASIVGDTSVTISDADIHTTSIVEDVYWDKSSNNPVYYYPTITLAEGSITLTFPALTEAVTWSVVIRNEQ